MISRIFNVNAVCAAGGAARVAPPTVAHVLALEAFKSPFIAGGKIGAKDVALAVWILATPQKRLVSLGDLAGERKQWKICKFYADNPADAEKDAAKIADLLKGSLCFYRSTKDENAKKTEAVLGLAIAARLMAIFGYSREAALAERADWAVALIETLFALDGRMRIVSEEQARLMDELDAAEKAAENGGKG